MSSIIGLLIAGLYIYSGWRVFEKAGVEGWKSIIPFYNAYIALQLAGKPGWWLVLFFIPIVNIVIAVIFCIEFAKTFGKSGAWGVFLLFFFGFIGWPILAFSDDKYTAPAPSAA